MHYLEFKPHHHQTVNTACADMLSEGGTNSVYFLLKLESFFFLTESKQVLMLAMLQAVRFQPHTWSPRSIAKRVHLRYVLDGVAMGRVFLRVL